MDHNTNVIKWASEPFKIKYFLPTDGKWHKYTPDFYCEINTNQGKKIQLIEVKPKQQSKPPKPPKKKTAKSLRNFKALQLTVFKNDSFILPQIEFHLGRISPIVSPISLCV